MTSAEPSPSGERRLGRRPGDPNDTRSAILSAARERFGEVGFDRATIRAIAESAGVDPALIIHHFGSKQGLFAAAHELPGDPARIIDQIIDLPAADRARALTEAYLSMVLHPGSTALSIMRTAATNERAAAMMHEFVTDVFLSRADELAPGPDGTLRLALAGSQMVGLAFLRGIIGVDVATRASVEDLIDHVTPTIEHYLNGG